MLTTCAAKVIVWTAVFFIETHLLLRDGVRPDARAVGATGFISVSSIHVTSIELNNPSQNSTIPNKPLVEFHTVNASSTDKKLLCDDPVKNN